MNHLDPDEKMPITKSQDGLERHDDPDPPSPYEDLGYGLPLGPSGDDVDPEQVERDAMASILANSRLSTELSGPHRVHAIQVQEFVGRLAGDGVPPTGRPRFCATDLCHGVAELIQSTDGAWRPGSHCGPCARQLGLSRTIAKVQRAVTRIPERSRRMTFSSPEVMRYVPEDKIQQARRAVDDPLVLSVVIAGGTGNGKTILAAAMCNHVLSKARVGCTTRELDRASRIGWTSAASIGTAKSETKLGTGIPEIIRSAIYASFLVIDELGRETGEDGSSAVWRVIDGRHEQSRPTVMTTFMSADELRHKYDGGFIRRFFEHQDRQSLCIDLGPKKKKGAT
jgi:DNA replication protein DnaC